MASTDVAGDNAGKGTAFFAGLLRTLLGTILKALGLDEIAEKSIGEDLYGAGKCVVSNTLNVVGDYNLQDTDTSQLAAMNIDTMLPNIKDERGNLIEKNAMQLYIEEINDYVASKLGAVSSCENLIDAAFIYLDNFSDKPCQTREELNGILDKYDLIKPVDKEINDATASQLSNDDKQRIAATYFACDSDEQIPLSLEFYFEIRVRVQKAWSAFNIEQDGVCVGENLERVKESLLESIGAKKLTWTDKLKNFAKYLISCGMCFLEMLLKYIWNTVLGLGEPISDEPKNDPAKLAIYKSQQNQLLSMAWESSKTTADAVVGKMGDLPGSTSKEDALEAVKTEKPESSTFAKIGWFLVSVLESGLAAVLKILLGGFFSIYNIIKTLVIIAKNWTEKKSTLWVWYKFGQVAGYIIELVIHLSTGAKKLKRLHRRHKLSFKNKQ